MKLRRINILSVQITFVVMLLLNMFGVTRSAQELTIDKLQRHTIHKLPIDKKVILVTIDNSSLEYILDSTGYSYPWPRDFYAHILDYLRVEQSGAVLLDILFYDSSRATSESESGEYDRLFAEAMRRHGRVYLAAQLSQEEKELFPQVSTYFTETPPESDYPQFNSIKLPIDILMRASAGVAGINVQTDKDGILRYVPVYYQIPGTKGSSCFIPSLPIPAIEQSRERKAKGPIPLKDGQYRLNWYSDEFVECPIKAVLQSAIATKLGGDKSIPDGYFKDAIVIIGATADGLNDLKHTPMGKQYPGMYAWATLILNALTGDYLRFPPPFSSIVILMGFLMLLLFITNKDRYALPLIYSLCLIATLEVVFIILWICYRIYLPISSVFILGVSYLLMFTFLSFAKEYNEKRKIRQMFGRYISKDVLKELEKNPHLVDLGGEEVQAAVMFSDVYDFTSLTETMSAKEMVGYLNEYFTVFGEFITDNKGLLEAYLGDGILAVFGVPVSAKQTSDYALNACTVAILQRRYARQLEIKDELSISDNLQIRTRIGIAGGVVIAGNIGSPSRMDYTVIGDAVNIASRLESINKFYKTNVIISVDIFESVKEEFICRKLDKIILKGKSTPLTIYELIDKKTDKSNNDYKWIKDYEEALRYYFEGDFQKASGLFKSLYNSPLHDEPSGIMQSRCNDLIENPPGEWEGVFTMEVK